MRVGLNLLFLVPGQVGGVETFARELLDALDLLENCDTDYVVFTSLDAQDLFSKAHERLKIVVCPFHARRRVVRYFWEQFILPFLALRARVDILHSLSYVGPVLCLAPTIVTIHDANSSVVGQTMAWYRRIGLSTLSRLASRTSNLVTTVSEFSKQELIKWYKLKPASVRVVLSGPGRQPQPSDETAPLPISGIRSGEPYISVIGGTYPHKNIPRLIEAFARIQDQIEHKLVILGKLAQEAQDAIRLIKPGRVILTGYVSDAQLRQAIRQSDLFVMPSLYEGFGFPVLEAQSQGVPVACSNRGSLPEVAGESAVLFDPENVAEIADSVLRCVRDSKVNETLRALSRENAARFSWKKAAQEYHDCYLRLASPKRGERSVGGNAVRSSQ